MRYPLALACTLAAAPLNAHDVRVVTDLPVTQSLVAMVLGEHGTVEALLDRGADAHSFQLRPSQAEALAQAGLVIWTGDQMAPWMGRAIAGPGGDAEAVALLDVDGVMLRTFGQDAGAQGNAHADHDDPHAHEDHEDHGDAHGHAGHDDAHGHEDHDDVHAHEDHDGAHAHEHHGDEHGHDHGDQHAHDTAGHDHSGVDPHAWLNTRNAAVWIDAIAAELATHMPDHAAAFATNADAAKAEIAALTADLQDTLAPARDMAFVTFHDAYGYFVDQFDLTQAGTIALGDAASPGAGRLAELRRTLQQDDVGCIFPEANHDPALVDTVAEGTDVRRGAALDPAGTTLAPGADLYPRLMRAMADAIADCAARG